MDLLRHHEFGIGDRGSSSHLPLFLGRSSLEAMENVNFSRAYNYIRERILSGEFGPGQPLMPDVLAGSIGISRTPIRDALRQLNADGLVSIRARVGASVRSIDMVEYNEMCGLRMALEIHAAGLAARLKTDNDVREIAFLHEAFKAENDRIIATSGPNQPLVAYSSEVLVREDIRFHLAIMSAGRNKLMLNEIIRHHLINRIVTSGALVDFGRPAPVNRNEQVAMMMATVVEHTKILEAIARGDPVAARTAMESHLQDDADTILSRMARIESGQIAGALSKMPAPPAAETAHITQSDTGGGKRAKGRKSARRQKKK